MLSYLQTLIKNITVFYFSEFKKLMLRIAHNFWRILILGGKKKMKMTNTFNIVSAFSESNFLIPCQKLGEHSKEKGHGKWKATHIQE